MENTTNIINDDIKPKRAYTEAQLRAVKAFRERNKDSEEYKIKQRANSKRSYEKNRDKVIARVRANQRRNQEIEQLERLHELKEQGNYNKNSKASRTNSTGLNNLIILAHDLLVSKN